MPLHAFFNLRKSPHLADPLEPAPQTQSSSHSPPLRDHELTGRFVNTAPGRGSFPAQTPSLCAAPRSLRPQADPRRRRSREPSPSYLPPRAQAGSPTRSQAWRRPSAAAEHRPRRCRRASAPAPPTSRSQSPRDSAPAPAAHDHPRSSPSEPTPSGDCPERHHSPTKTGSKE